jgi:predicted O-methyltransferase YrrM
MSSKTLFLTQALYDYMRKVSLRDQEIFRHLREETSHDPMAQMQISPEQGQFMALLIKLMGAEKALEIGVYTGYSSLCVALALPAHGRLVACDINAAWTSVARRYWTAAEVAHKVELHLAPAMETLDGLLEQGQGDTFDFVFIDADKENYDGYYERALTLLRTGGLIAIDNVFWGGRVADPGIMDKDTLSIRSLNEKLQKDDRIELSTLPIGDGLTLACRRR